MDFELPEEYKMLKGTVRRFVDMELIPIERNTLEGGELKPEVGARLRQRANELGLWLMDVPTEYGGQGLGLLSRVVVWEELARTAALPNRGEGITGPDVMPILYGLSDEQKKDYLYPVLRGEKRSCFAQTEPDAGSDPGSMRTTAVRDGDYYVINGVKRYITFADKAAFTVLMAATDRAKGSRGGISMFLVDMNAPGVSIPVKYKTMMDDDACEVVFDNVRVPVKNRVGEEGEGFKVGQKWVTVSRLRHGARALGVAERCLEMAASYAKQRVTFGAPLADRQAIQWMLADSYVDMHATRLMLYDATCRFDRGEDVRTQAYIVKLFGDEMAFRVIDRCLQIHGGLGLTTELPIERFWRQQRSLLITDGPSEIMRMVIARHVLRTYAR